MGKVSDVWLSRKRDQGFRSFYPVGLGISRSARGVDSRPFPVTVVFPGIKGILENKRTKLELKKRKSPE